MTNSGLNKLISPAICFPSFCPISSTISIHRTSSLFTASTRSSSETGSFDFIRLERMEFSPFSIRLVNIRCNAEPETSVSDHLFSLQ